MNVHIHRDNAEAASRILGDFSTLPVVLDHSLYPKVGPDLDDTLRAIRKLAERDNLHVKLTFVATGSLGGYPCEIFRELLPLSSRDRAMILGGTASRLWFED